VPASPWLDDRQPPKPTLTLNAAEDQWQLKITSTGKPIRIFVIRSLMNGKWTTSIQAANGDNVASLTFKASPEEVRVSAIDRVGNESPAASVKR
jgi:hypothetical protein